MIGEYNWIEFSEIFYIFGSIKVWRRPQWCTLVPIRHQDFPDQIGCQGQTSLKTPPSLTQMEKSLNLTGRPTAIRPKCQSRLNLPGLWQTWVTLKLVRAPPPSTPVGQIAEVRRKSISSLLCTSSGWSVTFDLWIWTGPAFKYCSFFPFLYQGIQIFAHPPLCWQDISPIFSLGGL